MRQCSRIDGGLVHIATLCNHAQTSFPASGVWLGTAEQAAEQAGRRTHLIVALFSCNDHQNSPHITAQLVEVVIRAIHGGWRRSHMLLFGSALHEAPRGVLALDLRLKTHW